MLPLLVGGLAAVGVLIVFVVLARAPETPADRLARYTDTSTINAGGAVVESDRAGVRARVDRFVARRGMFAGTAESLAQAALSLRPLEFILARIGFAFGMIFAGLALLSLGGLFGSWLWPIAGLVVGLLGPRFWLNRRKSRRLKAFEDALADTITLLSNALRAGSSFLQAVELITRETAPPISIEFNRLIRDVNVGLPLDDALANLQRRVRSADLELMTTAISIQHSVGGNLADILDTISTTIRERVRIQGEIRVLTATQRLSGYVIGLMPVGLIGILFLVSPNYMTPMFTQPPAAFGMPLGFLLLGLGGVSMFFGFIAIRRIVDISV